mgnify:CR=1 FL=1
MSQIINVTPRNDYKLEVYLENGSIIVLNLESKLKTVRFGMLADKEFFMKAATDGSYIRWGNFIEISIKEVFQLANS